MTLKLSLEEIDRILAWQKEHTDLLRRHASWLKTIDGQALPCCEVAIAEIQKDIGVNIELILKLLEHRKALRAAA